MNIYLRHNRLFAFLILFVPIALWGCYPKSVGPLSADGKRPTWREMKIPERKVHMKNVVLPRATIIFQQWRPERFATVDCTLCHGPGVYSETFQMPNDYLPRLSGKLLLGPELKTNPDTTRLKLNSLVPTIADALGLKPFSIVTRRGFGCYSCHLGPSGPMFGN